MSVWTFIRCGKDGKPDGDYGEEYETATGKSLECASGGTATAEFVHDEDMPPFMRYRGWWGMMQLYNPDADIGNDDGNIYSGGIDTVFLRDIDKLEAAFNAVDADIVGVRCPNRGGFNTMLLRIRKGSPGAMRVWNAATSSDKYHPRMVAFQGMEHKFVENVAKDYIGTIPDELADSYKLHVGLFPDHTRKRQDIDNISALFFHGSPRPHDVCENQGSHLRDIVVENWGRHIGFE